METSEQRLNQEYQFGHEIIVSVTNRKLEEMQETDMGVAEQIDKMEQLRGPWHEILDYTDKEQGN